MAITIERVRTESVHLNPNSPRIDFGDVAALPSPLSPTQELSEPLEVLRVRGSGEHTQLSPTQELCESLEVAA
jgi:hypothetical protein